MKVRWTARALSHLRDIQDHIAIDSADAGRRMIEAIFKRSEQLRQFPESGRMAGQWSGRPYREIVEHPYRLLYETREGSVFVIGVVHGRRDLRQVLAGWEKRP